MTSWIMLACGCLLASLGVLTLSGRHGARYRHPQKAGWGFILFGAGFALDGVPRLAGWSFGVGSGLMRRGHDSHRERRDASVPRRPNTKGGPTPDING